MAREVWNRTPLETPSRVELTLLSEFPQFGEFTHVTLRDEGIHSSLHERKCVEDTSMM